MLEFCQQAGIPASEVDSINSAESVRLLQEHKIDLLVYAGAGILKKTLIEAVAAWRAERTHGHAARLPRDECG